jgi:hypothetical protein
LSKFLLREMLHYSVDLLDALTASKHSPSASDL